METLAQQRQKICEACPLYLKSKFGPKCNPMKYLSPDGKTASYVPKDGYTKGCSCLLQYKWANANNHCAAGLW